MSIVATSKSLIFCVGDRQEPRCVCHVGPLNDDRANRNCRLAYRVMFDQIHKWRIAELFGSTNMTRLD
jgi:hypothetical protein